MKVDELPSGYKAPQKIVLGTNTLENVNLLLSFNGFVPILIGDGKKPRVWINIPTNREGSEWYPLVKDNFSTNDKVVVLESKKSIKITTPDGIILECYKLDDGIIDVKLLNLKPFGLNVVADDKRLMVMNQTFTSSIFKNIGTMIGIGNA
ncbi:hypothetical protein ACFFLG_02330 [Shewanella indica]|uniref:hypothetical protein n=1 Tax=Shewanella indica TaxID=768528 RepID=UPI000C33AF76|nr:hypothetical protein [Shewanella indica]GHB00517.1 hypothetical protein GCM10007107_11660 [Shewanella indica]